jgi:hypothetical protein
MNDKPSFVEDPLVITKQLKLYFNNSSRIPTQVVLGDTFMSKLSVIVHRDTVEYLEVMLPIPGKNFRPDQPKN